MVRTTMFHGSLAIATVLFLAAHGGVEGRCASFPAFAFTQKRRVLLRPQKLWSETSILYMSSSFEKDKPGNTSKKRQKRGNSNLVGSISSDGKFSGPTTKSSTSRVGVPSKAKKKNNQSSKMSKQERQRTGNGRIDSRIQSNNHKKEDEPVQILEAKRGSKVVTIIRYVKRKNLLVETTFSSAIIFCNMYGYPSLAGRVAHVAHVQRNDLSTG